MRSVLYVLASVAAVVLMAGSVSASTMFTDEFTGGPSANWANPTAANFSSNNAKFPGGDNARTYLYTVRTDYNTVNFTATAKVTNSDWPWGCAFFGIGDGGVNPSGPPTYEEPCTSQGLYINIFGGSTPAAQPDLGAIKRQSANTVLQTLTGGNLAAGTTIGVMLDWVASTKTATFKLDINNNGSFNDAGDVSRTVNNVNWLDSSHSSLFFGGAHNVVVDNFSVTPEPGTLVLLATGLIGLLAYAWRRRR
jgi:hypothetical protein